MSASVSAEGQRAFKAYRRQRELAFAAPAKLDTLDLLLHQHRADRTLIFTQDNKTAYDISRRFLIPAITHQTKITE
jgi:superfamily II DNA or RNA helicase